MVRLCILLIAVVTAGGRVRSADPRPQVLDLSADSANEVGTLGLTIDQQTFLLPAPTMQLGMTDQQQQEALRLAADKYPLERFTRDSIVSPFVFQRTNLTDGEGQRIGYQLDVWFVAYGSIPELVERDLLRRLAATDQTDDGEGAALDAEELAQRKITIVQPEGITRGLFQFSAPLLDRVQVAAVAGTEQVVRNDLLRGVIQIDPRFDADPTYPNRWWPEDESSDRFGVAAVAYHGFVGYAQATQMIEPEGAMLVECHALLHEPYEWFDGRALLASKLPLLVQDNVRGFRRALSRR